MAARPSVIALVIAVIVPLGWVAYDIWLGPHDIHAPAPVAKVHERFNCRDCHGRPWQPVESLIAADQNLACSALDEACVRCHQGLVHHREEIRREVSLADGQEAEIGGRRFENSEDYLRAISRAR